MIEPVAGPGFAFPTSGVFRTALWQTHAAIDGHAQYQLHVQLGDPAPKSQAKAALLIVVFLDERGAVMAGPYPGLLYSRQLSQHFRYVAASREPDREKLPAIAVQPPAGAAAVALALVPWWCSAELTLRAPPRLAPRVAGPGELSRLEVDDPVAAQRACRAALAQAPGDWRLLAYATGLAERQGDAAWLQACATAVLESSAPGPAIARARVALSRLDELSTDWLPLPPPCPAAVPGGPRRQARVPGVLHWVGEADETTGDAVSVQARPPVRGWRQVTVTPLEYVAAAQPAGPWRKGRVPAQSPPGRRAAACYALDCLSAQGVEAVARTDVMTLDVLLAWRICRDEEVAMIHAHPGRRGYDLMLRALALGRLSGLPVVYEYESARAGPRGSLGECWPADSSLSRLHQAQDSRCLRAADAVLVRRAEDGDRARQAGVAADRIVVVGDAATEADAATLARVYAMAGASRKAVADTP
ncbi:hypothetical protein ANDO1_3649 [plant metagenome]|uniref:Uncharacterized protein n=1 Tax=plant metagenome TaxID=1297885 RepID=A0A484PFC6_9ZZZZ